jgi:hypothetical protein
MLMQNRVLWKKLKAKGNGKRLVVRNGSMAVITVENR